MRRMVGALALMAMLGLAVVPASAQRGPGGGGRWVPLGSATVGFLVDRDVIRIGQDEAWFRREGAFRALRFTAERNDIHMTSVRVVYLNGHAETFTVGQLIRPGQSFDLDLRGERSFLREIEMVYRSRPNFRGQAVMRVEGQAVRVAPPPAPPPVAQGLVPLGSATVGLGVDRDVIRVNQPEDWFRRQAAFRALHFQVQRNDVHLMAIRLVYLNGHAEDFRIDQGVRPGQDYVLDLRGDRSFLREIEMTYRSRPGFRGEAVMQVLGEPIQRRGPEWSRIGLVEADRRSPQVVIPIGREAGNIGQIVLNIRGGSVNVRELVIRFGDRSQQVVPIGQRMEDGAKTESIDLTGERRVIEAVLVNLTPSRRPGQVTFAIQGSRRPGS